MHTRCCDVLPILRSMLHSAESRAGGQSACSMQVTGFIFMQHEDSCYHPPADLEQFLAPPHAAPIYIGFGSLVLQDPKATTEIIYEAVRRSGRRAVLSRGWAGLGDGVPNKPDAVFLLGDCPHSWLLPRCSAAVHHGGAGTTAAALRAGLPTLVVRRTMHR
jgi:sterol 3beta-glucosyltransferase